MTSDLITLRLLIKYYIQRVSQAINDLEIMESEYPLYTDILSGMETRDIPRIGSYLLREIEKYCFHGVGCRVTYTNGYVVDFDFGPNRINKGFDVWFFVDFVKSLKQEKYKEYEDEKRVKQLLSEMVETGELYPPGSLEPYGYSDRVYYFKEDFEYLKAERPWED